MQEPTKYIEVPKVDPKTVVGAGKLQDLAIRCFQSGVDLVVFDQDLTPSQARNLSERMELRVIDRTQLILDIFSQRATTRDGKLQVELAQLKYRMPRLAQREDLSLSKDDLAVLANAKKAGAPVTLVLISGRPLVLGDALAQADAVVAAWLPGSEGQGVADVLLGDHKPTGKLPVSWPRSMAQLPINVGDATYDPLFPFGFGLTY